MQTNIEATLSCPTAHTHHSARNCIRYTPQRQNSDERLPIEERALHQCRAQQDGHELQPPSLVYKPAQRHAAAPQLQSGPYVYGPPPLPWYVYHSPASANSCLLSSRHSTTTTARPLKHWLLPSVYLPYCS